MSEPLKELTVGELIEQLKKFDSSLPVIRDETAFGPFHAPIYEAVLDTGKDGPRVLL